MHPEMRSVYLFPPSIDSIMLAVIADSPSTWKLHCWHRHQAGDDAGCPPDIYELVTPAELLVLVDAVLSELLDWPGGASR